MQLGVEHLDLAVGLDIAGLDFTLAARFDINRFRAVAVKLKNNTFDVEDDLSDVLFDAGNSRKFMLNTGDFNGSNSCTGKRG